MRIERLRCSLTSNRVVDVGARHSGEQKRMGGARKSWEVTCEDGFGRSRVLLVEADRASGRVVVIAPPGEAGVLVHLGAYELTEAIRSAWVFANSQAQTEGDAPAHQGVTSAGSTAADAGPPGRHGEPRFGWPADSLLIS